MNRILRYFAFMLGLIFLTACEDEAKDQSLDFVGDSIIARWDLAECFPSRDVYNYGRSGEGIDYLESLAGKFAGRVVVVLIGTNNNGLMTADRRMEYAGQYVDALKALGADRIYLYSVLPRDFGQDRPEINKDIIEFNKIVEGLVADDGAIVYLNVYEMFIRDGKPDPQLYNDGLHLSPYGYEILTKTLDKVL